MLGVVVGTVAGAEIGSRVEVVTLIGTEGLTTIILPLRANFASPNKSTRIHCNPASNGCSPTQRVTFDRSMIQVERGERETTTPGQVKKSSCDR
jgi:hypothetical protein